MMLTFFTPYNFCPVLRRCTLVLSIYINGDRARDLPCQRLGRFALAILNDA